MTQPDQAWTASTSDIVEFAAAVIAEARATRLREPAPGWFGRADQWASLYHQWHSGQLPAAGQPHAPAVAGDVWL